VRSTKITTPLRSTVTSRSRRAPSACGSPRRSFAAADDDAIVVRASGVAAISLATLAGEVDEDGLEAGLGDRDVGDHEAAALRRRDHPGQQAVRAAHAQLESRVGLAGPGHPLDALLEGGASSLVARSLDRHDGVDPHRLLQLGRRVERQDPAVVHDRHAVAELVGLFHVVVVSRMVCPSAFSCWRMSHSASGSGVEPAVGSSMKSTAGLWKIDLATMSRWAMPPDRA